MKNLTVKSSIRTPAIILVLIAGIIAAYIIAGSSKFITGQDLEAITTIIGPISISKPAITMAQNNVSGLKVASNRDDGQTKTI